MTCEYCGKYIPNQLTECPYCGAANPVYKKLEDEIALTKEKISQSEKELERLKNERDAKKKAAAEADREAAEGITMAAICSIVTAFAETVSFTLDRNVNFMIIFIVFYIGNLLGNSFLFAVLSGFKANKIVKLIFSAGFMILGCLIFNPINSTANDKNYSDYTWVNHTEKVSIIASDYDKPVDGMTLEQVQDLNWGILILNKCRDFDHLRVKNRYYEAKWFNSKGDKIGSGLIVYDSNDESDTRLVYFRDYTED